jgi:hypothetical protein
MHFTEEATQKELRRCLLITKASQLFQSCDREMVPSIPPQGFKANPGLELANAFSVRGLANLYQRIIVSSLLPR